MKILFYFLSAEQRIPPNLEILLRTLANEFPEDTYYTAIRAPVTFGTGDVGENIKIIPIKAGVHLEWTRLRMSYGGIARLAQELQADVIWSINIGLYHRTAIPQVLSLRNAFQVYPPSVAQFHPHNRLWVGALRYFFRKSLRYTDAVIVQTPLMVEYVRQTRCAPAHIALSVKAVESDADVVIEPLPERITRQLDEGLGRGAFTFFYAATLGPHENHATLAAAMEILRREGAETRVALTLSAEEVRAAAGDHGRSLLETGHLLPLGYIGKSHLRPLYEACDGCVMPSLLESLSSSHLEAMQWGKPQICADLPYARDLCGEAALYAAPQAPGDWAAKIRRFIDDADLRTELVEAGRRRIATYPKTWADVAHNTRQIFEQAVASKKQRALA